VAGEPSLASIVGAVAHCAHPEEAATPAVVLEPDGARLLIYWCGCCGGLCVPGKDVGEWITPGLGIMIEAADRVASLSRGLDSLVEYAAKISTISRCLREILMPFMMLEPVGAELAEYLDMLDDACGRIDRFSQAALTELRT